MQGNDRPDRTESASRELPPVTPATPAELDQLERLVAAVLNPTPEQAKIAADSDGYYWSKARNTLNHYANPAFLLRVVQTIRDLEPAPSPLEGMTPEELVEVVDRMSGISEAALGRRATPGSVMDALANLGPDERLPEPERRLLADALRKVPR